MCKWGTYEIVEVTIPAELSCTGKEEKKKKKIDKCIAPIVKALEKAGITMRASCCGHGENGVIMLQDGRRLIIKPQWKILWNKWIPCLDDKYRAEL